METSQLTGISRGKFADLSIKRAGAFQDINTVLDGITSGGGGVDLSDYYTSAQTDAAIQVETAARTAALQQETSARNLLATSTATALASKQVQLTAGANIQLSNVGAISATGPVELAVDGVLKTATRLDFVAPTSSLASGVLTIGPPDFQSRLSLIHASSADAKDLTRNQAGKLLWDNDEVASKASVDDERTARQQFQSDTNAVLNTKQTVDDPQTRVRLGTTSAYTDLTRSATGSLVWGSNDIVEAPTLNALETYTIAQLALKQDTVVAGSGISISGTTISATGGGSALELAVNGTTQSGATKLDFLANEAVLSGTTLLLGPPLTTRVGLWFASSSDHKDLTQGSGGVLKWGADTVALTSDVPDLSGSVTIGGQLAVEGSQLTLSNATTSLGYGLPIFARRSSSVDYLSLGFTQGTHSGGSNDDQALAITRQGVVTVRGGSIGSHSDARLKTDVADVDATECMALLRGVNAKTYKRIDMEGGRRLGFIAQDLQSDAFPNLVFPAPTGFLSLDYARLSAVLWSCVKSLDARVAALEAVAANP